MVLSTCVFIFIAGNSRADAIKHSRPACVRQATSIVPEQSIENGIATVYYDAAMNGELKIDLFTGAGGYIDRLIVQEVMKGQHYQFEFDTTMLSPGTYYLTIEDNQHLEHKRIEVVK